VRPKKSLKVGTEKAAEGLWGGRYHSTNWNHVVGKQNVLIGKVLQLKTCLREDKIKEKGHYSKEL